MTILDLPPGLHDDVPMDVYHARHLGLVSTGALSYLADSPAHYYAWATGQIDDEETPSLGLGRAIHSAILEPEKFAKQYVIAPDFGPQRKTDACSSEEAKANKERKKAWMAEHADATILDSASGKTTLGMVKKLATDPDPKVRKLLSSGRPEVTMRWRDPETGLQCRARPDWYSPEFKAVIDFKSTENASREAFERSAAKYRYGWQEVHYRAGFAALGLPVEHFLFVAIEKSPPYEFMIHSFDIDSVARSHSRVRDLMHIMAECMATESWPGYSRSIQTITLPPWAA